MRFVRYALPIVAILTGVTAAYLRQGGKYIPVSRGVATATTGEKPAAQKKTAVITEDLAEYFLPSSEPTVALTKRAGWRIDIYKGKGARRSVEHVHSDSKFHSPAIYEIRSNGIYFASGAKMADTPSYPRVLTTGQDVDLKLYRFSLIETDIDGKPTLCVVSQSLDHTSPPPGHLGNELFCKGLGEIYDDYTFKRITAFKLDETGNYVLTDTSMLDKLKEDMRRCISAKPSGNPGSGVRGFMATTCKDSCYADGGLTSCDRIFYDLIQTEFKGQ